MSAPKDEREMIAKACIAEHKRAMMLLSKDPAKRSVIAEVEKITGEAFIGLLMDPAYRRPLATDRSELIRNWVEVPAKDRRLLKLMGKGLLARYRIDAMNALLSDGVSSKGENGFNW